MMKKISKIAAMILCGFSTFTIFPAADDAPAYSADHDDISKQAGKITERAWKMTGKALREALERGVHEQEDYSR